MMTGRSVQSMKEFFKHTKLEDSYSGNTLQAVTFSSTLFSDEYKLFEVSDCLAAKLIAPGSRTVLELKEEPRRTNNEGRVFACTEEETFSMIEAETSNSLLLTRGWWLPGAERPTDEGCSDDKLILLTPSVVAVKKAYFELHVVPSPSLHLLWKALIPSSYHGPIEEVSDSDDVYSGQQTAFKTRTELVEMFPCSQLELNRSFSRLHVCEIGGYMRLINLDYLNQVVKDIFACADENAWDWRTQGFCLNSILSNLNETHNPVVLGQIISRLFASRTTRTSPCSSPSSDANPLFPITSKICQIVGEHILSVTTSFDLTDFMAVWRATVPEGLRPHLRRHLTCAGRAYCQPSSISHTGKSQLHLRSIHPLRSEELPDDNAEVRLSALFQRCSLWPEAELASFLNEMVLIEENNDTPYCDSMSLVNELEYDEFLVGDAPPDIDDDDDAPRPIHPNVSALLSRYCRSADVLGPNGCRVYIQKHAVM